MCMNKNHQESFHVAWSTWVSILLAVCCSESLAAPELELKADLGRVQREVANRSLFNPATCAGYLSRHTRFLLERGAETYMPRDSAGLRRLREQAPALLERMFRLRLSLAEWLRTFHDAGAVPPDCVDAIRRALRYSRFVEELLAEFLVKGKEQALPTVALQGGAPSLLVNPVFAPLELRSGDLLLVRGSSFVSAAIARIGDEDGQFSHLAMAYMADDGGKYVMEALIDSGVVIVPLDQWLSHGPARLLVFRHQDARLAEQAARDLHDWIAATRESGRTIPYDYRMDTQDRSEFFCAELVGFAYERTSAGRLRLPAYPTSLQVLRGHPFLDNMGIRGRTTFAPADVELEPQLRLVAEWRNLRHSAETRIKDAILTSLLDWMATRGYQLTYRGLLQGGVEIYWALLRPFGVLQEKLPANMEKSFLKTLLGLNSAAGLVYERIAPPLLEASEDNPLALDYKAILAAIEEYRRRDCRRLRAHRRWQRDNPVHMDGEDEPPRAELHYLIEVPGVDGCPLGN
jgi:hypothetical protein